MKLLKVLSCSLLLAGCSGVFKVDAEAVFGAKPVDQVPDHLIRTKIWGKTFFDMDPNYSCRKDDGTFIPSYRGALQFTEDFKVKKLGDRCSNQVSVFSDYNDLDVGRDSKLLGLKHLIFEDRPDVASNPTPENLKRQVEVWCSLPPGIMASEGYSEVRITSDALGQRKTSFLTTQSGGGVTPSNEYPTTLYSHASDRYYSAVLAAQTSFNLNVFFTDVFLSNLGNAWMGTRTPPPYTAYVNMSWGTCRTAPLLGEVTGVITSKPGFPGDANGDGCVDGGDYTSWADHFHRYHSLGAAKGDFNWDGFVDNADKKIFDDNYNTCAPQN